MALYYDVTITYGDSKSWRVAVPADDNGGKYGELLDAIIKANTGGPGPELGLVFRHKVADKCLRRRPSDAMTYLDFRGAVI